MRTDEQYIAFDPYADESVVRYKRVKLVTTKAPHQCFGYRIGQYGVEYCAHEIPAGTRARFETAQVDGEWAKFYTCLACIDLYLDDWDRCNEG